MADRPANARRLRDIGRAAALGPRTKARSLLRRVHLVLALRLIRAARRLVPSARGAEYLAIEPAPSSPAAWADVAARLAWYLPGLDMPVVARGVLAPDPSEVPHIAAELVHAPNALAERATGREHVVLTELSVRHLARRGRRLGATTLVDPHVWTGEDTRGFPALMDLFGGAGGSTAPMERLLDQRVEGGTALIIATGPTADSLDLDAFDADIRITCNSAVRNLAFIEQFRPHVIAFGDPIHHLGPSRYAAAFRADLVTALQQCDALAVLPPLGARLMTQHHPEVADRFICLPTDKGPWRWPSLEDPRVHHTGNILTVYMLPVAFALADHVLIAGCDGRKSDEKLFWRHSRTIQYDDELMETLYTTHPGWYRDRDYADYYSKHCDELEELIQVGEAHDKSVLSVTDSFIPALTRRRAP